MASTAKPRDGHAVRGYGTLCSTMRYLSVILCLALGSCASPGNRYTYRDAIGAPPLSDAEIRRIADNLGPFPGGGDDPTAVARYLRAYACQHVSERHFCGYVPGPIGSILTHLFLPDNATHLVLMVHGYLEHSLANGNAIRFLASRGYGVLALDLPGHGLSDGRPGHISDFRLYAESIHAVLQASASVVDLPRSAMGHSTGAAALLEHHYRYGPAFEQLVFVGPLVRSYLWGPSKIGVPLADVFTNRVGRRINPATSDPATLAFLREDPLSGESTHLEFARALFAWEKRQRGYTYPPARVIVLQGTRDTVVSWRYNVSYLSDRFDADVHLLHGAKHNVLSEVEPLQSQAFETLELAFPFVAGHD